ncbi:globin isoform X2 [Eurytemora carolleeae]|nr:globin isoform X2 [Eurytemora carolleeae]|eukprot:XP_023336328.1 globin-like isoform X2 [Eurytemora affinis]
MGLEQSDIDEVQKSWDIAKSAAKLREHGIGFFELLFKTYPDWREQFFGHLGTMPFAELKDTPKFRAHAGLVMSTLNFWVSNLDDIDLVVASVQKTGRNHSGRGIKEEEFKKIGEVVLAYLKLGLKDAFTEEMSVGWTNLLATVVTIIKAENEKED